MALRKVKPVVLKKEQRQIEELEKEYLKKRQVEQKIETSPKSEDDVSIPPYKIQGTSLMLQNKKTKRYEHICNAVKIIRINRNIESGEITLELSFWVYDRWESIRINRGDLVKRELKKLASKGMDIIEDIQLSHVSIFLNRQEKILKPLNTHSGIGWEKHNDEMMYKHYELITKPMSSIKSTYDGKFHLKPKGSISEYKRLIINEVIGNIPLEVMLCIGITPLIIGMLNQSNNAEIDSLIVHLPGKSTTGKTTAVMLTASIAGSPALGENGLVQTYNGTKNAMSKLLIGNYGVPLVFDESSMNQMGSESLSSFLYEIAQNHGRLRLDRNSELMSPGTWSTTVISTGESSIIKKANQNEGLRVRLIEFPSVTWTKDAKNAERLKNGLIKCYGHVAPAIAKTMIEHGPIGIAKMVDENKKDIVAAIPDSRFADRIASKLALIVTAAELFEETFNIYLSGQELVDWLVEQEKDSMTEREMTPKFYEQLRQYIVRFSKNFKRNDQVPQNEIWGKIEVYEGKSYCYILPLIFEKITKELGFTETKIILDELKHMGVLDHEKNKNQKRKVIFSKNEVDKREEILGKDGFSKRGDYTICVVYEGDILKDY